MNETQSFQSLTGPSGWFVIFPRHGGPWIAVRIDREGRASGMTEQRSAPMHFAVSEMTARKSHASPGSVFVDGVWIETPRQRPMVMQ